MKTILFLLFLPGIALTQDEKPQLVVPIGHKTHNVISVAFSPDGKYILTGSDDNTAKMWDLSGRVIQTFMGHTEFVGSVAFSPDGKTVLTGSNDHTAKLWDLSGQIMQTFTGHTEGVNSAVFSPDGKIVLTGSYDNTAKLWDLSGQIMQTFTGYAKYITSVAFSPDGKTVLTGSGDNTAKLWDLSGREMQTFTGHANTIQSVAFSPDGKTVLTGSTDNTAKLWDLSGRVIQTFTEQHEDRFNYTGSVAFSPDGKTVLKSAAYNTAKLWDLSGRVIQTFKGHTGYVCELAFSPDGKTVLTGSNDNTAKMWDLSGRVIQAFKGHTAKVNSVAFSPDGKTVLTGGEDNTAKLWDLSGRKMQTFTGHTDFVNSVVFSPDGKTVLTGSEDNTTKLWDLSGRKMQTFRGTGDFVTSAIFSPDSKTVLTGGWDKTAKLWDLSGNLMQTFKGHGEFIISVAFSPDGKTVLTGSLDKTAKLWDLSGNLMQNFKGHEEFIISVAFSPDGKTVLTGSADNKAALWDLDGRKIQTFDGHTSLVRSVAFSPDGKQVLTGSDDYTAKLWDLSGRQIQSFSSHASEVSSVAFSSDGKHILTGSFDNTTKLWDTKSGKELATLITIDSNDWVVTTPSGLFDASPGAMKLMHYVVGLEVIDLEQLKERYYEPSLLAKILGFDKNELRNVAAFDQVALYPEIKASITNHQLQIQLNERSGGLGKLSLFLNGKEVQEDLNPKRLKNLNIDLKNFAKYYQADTIITVALRPYNAEGWLKSQAYELNYKPAANPVGKTIPQLYAVVVGTSNYAGDRLDLRFADLDAEAMAKALQSTAGALFGTGHTSVHLLSTNAPAELSSKNNIRRAFARIAAKSSPADVLVVYFSGHGIAYGDAEKAQFYYLTKDIGSEDLSDPEIRSKYAISSDTLTKWLTDIPAKKQVMILDACNAGKVLETLAALDKKELDPSQIRAFDRMKDRTGMFILTGSAADRVSYEASQYGQGLLTYSLLQGMSGLALKENKYVDVNTLFQYACDRVPLLAQGIGGVQKPIVASPGGASFDIGIARPGAITVAPEKPVFIRNVFQEETSFDDVLGLTDALETLFQRITAKGARAEVIFVDVKEYGAAYSMKGRYTITGDAVEVRVRLFQGKTAVGEEFKVRGNKGAVGELAEAVFRKVGELVGIRH